MNKNAGAVLAFMGCVPLLAGGPALADGADKALLANIGYVSDYVFRGVEQANSSGSAGLDAYYEFLYAGTYVIDVGTGLEYDLYGGINGEWSGFSLDLNYTSYNYTRDNPRFFSDGTPDEESFFDDTSREVNLSLGYGLLSATLTRGVYDNFQGKIPGNEQQDYTTAVVRGAYQGFSVTYGVYGMDFDGSWWELGYNTEVGGFDAGINLVASNNRLDDEEYIVFSLRRVFDVLDALRGGEQQEEPSYEEEDFLVSPPVLLD
ncbi:MAG: hypothetical protein ACE5ET_02065 [Gammaproteobacteria bacterium]